jgi:tRNA(Ile)-lysidine synthase
LPFWRGEAQLWSSRDDPGFPAQGNAEPGGACVFPIPAVLFRSTVLSVRARVGGERLRLGPGRPSRSLKQHFQTAGVAPWQRDMPLFYLNDLLVFAPYLGGSTADLQTMPLTDDAGEQVFLVWVPWQASRE